MQQLILEKKAEVFLNETVYPLLKHFPKSEKFCLSQEIKQALYKVIQKSMLYNSIKDKKLLNEVDAQLKLLLALFSVARTQKYITEKKAYELQTKISELGRITGGLMKKT